MVKNVSDPVPSYAVRIGEGADDPSPSQAAASRREAVPAESMRQPSPRSRKIVGLFTLAAAVLVAINLLSWQGVFWAAWPVLGLAFLWALIWIRGQNRIDRRLAILVAIALGIVAINLLSWHGIFWAIWPLLSIAVAAGVWWVMRG